MIISGHQPDLLPCTSFWHKMESSDLFDLRIHDDFRDDGYQRRLMMHGIVSSVPVVGAPSHVPICDVRIIPADTALALTRLVTSHYRGARHWKTYGPLVLDLINDNTSEQLWQLNLSLIMGVRTVLDIQTPISIGRPDNHVTMDEPARGVGGRASFDTSGELGRPGVPLGRARGRPHAGDSILTVLMERDDPLAVVMAEHATDDVPV